MVVLFHWTLLKETLGGKRLRTLPFLFVFIDCSIFLLPFFYPEKQVWRDLQYWSFFTIDCSSNGINSEYTVYWLASIFFDLFRLENKRAENLEVEVDSKIW